MNAALLLRVSTDTQDLESQRRELIPVAEQMGYTVPDELIFGQQITGRDDVRKGTRESIVKLKEASEAGKVDAIFVYEVSRLSRSSIDGRGFVRDFNEMKIPIYFKDRSMWTLNPVTKEEETNNIFLIGLFFDFAEQELKTLKSRTMRGRRNSASKGLATGGYLNYGYKKDEQSGKIVIDEEEAPFIEDIFKKYASGDYSLGELTKYANSTSYQNRYKKNSSKGTFITTSGYRKNTDNTNWAVGVISKMLKNTIYIGKTHFQDVEKAVPPIIDIDTFNKVQKRLSSNPKYKEKSRNYVHLLQKLIFCGHCGYLYYGHIGTNGKGQYLCSSYHSSKINCGNVTFSYDKLEAIVWDYVKHNSFIFMSLPEEEKNKKINLLQFEKNELIEQISFLEKSSRLEQSKINNLLDMIEKGIFSIEAIKERKGAIDKAIMDNDRKIEELYSKIKLINNQIIQINNKEYSKELIKGIEADRNQMKKILNEVIESITAFKIDTQSSVFQIKLYGEPTVNILAKQRVKKTFKYWYINDSIGTFLNGNHKIESIKKCDNFYFSNPTILKESQYWGYYTFNELCDILEHSGFYSEYLPPIEYINPKSKKPEIIPTEENDFRKFMKIKYNTDFEDRNYEKEKETVTYDIKTNLVNKNIKRLRMWDNADNYSKTGKTTQFNY